MRPCWEFENQLEARLMRLIKTLEKRIAALERANGK